MFRCAVAPLFADEWLTNVGLANRSPEKCAAASRRIIAENERRSKDAEAGRDTRVALDADDHRLLIELRDETVKKYCERRSGIPLEEIPAKDLEMGPSETLEDCCARILHLIEVVVGPGGWCEKEFIALQVRVNAPCGRMDLSNSPLPLALLQAYANFVSEQLINEINASDPSDFEVFRKVDFVGFGNPRIAKGAALRKFREGEMGPKWTEAGLIRYFDALISNYDLKMAHASPVEVGNWWNAKPATHCYFNGVLYCRWGGFPIR